MNANHQPPDPTELAQATLTAYALGELSAGERTNVEALLARDPEARRFVEETRALGNQLRRAIVGQSAETPATAASPLREAILNHLRQKEGETMNDQVTGDLHEEKSGDETAKAKPLSLEPVANRRRRLTNWLVGTVSLVMISGVLAALILPATQSARECARSAQRANERKERELESMAAASMPSLDGPSESELPGLECPADESGELEFDVMHDLAEKTEPLVDELVDIPFSESEETSSEGKLVRVYGGGSQPHSKEVQPGYGLLRESSESNYSLQDGSGGGQRPPFPATPGTEQYDTITENSFLAVARRPLSTFSIDVDTASYANVRRFLSDGRLPPPAAVRIEEMINYFTYHYAPPKDERPFAVHTETAQCPWRPEHRLLRVGIKGKEIHRSERGPSNLVFLIDVSGSMTDMNKLPLVKQAMSMLVEELGEDDRVAIVTYASGTGVRLRSTSADQKQVILDAIEGLSSGGSTHGSAGIKLAYEQAAEHFIRGGTNRVILATDGDLNVGITRDDDLIELIKRKARSGVFLTVLGFGTGNLKDSKMEKLADHGNGVYAYIDGLREARRVLVEQLSGSLVTIAKDVKIQIEFNPTQVQAYRLIGYENRKLADRDFDDDKKDAGEIGAGHTVTALYELVPRGVEMANEDTPQRIKLKYQQVPERQTDEQQTDKEALPKRELTEAAASDELLTVKLRYKQPEGETSQLLEFAVKDEGQRFGRASDDFRFAASVAAFGMVLRHSQYCGDVTLSAVEEFAAGALGDDPKGYRAEFVDLVRRAKQLGAQ